jgi:DNA-binding CsgD family transcriptional regulator
MYFPSLVDLTGEPYRAAFPDRAEDLCGERKRRTRARVGIAAVDAVLETLEHRGHAVSDEPEAEILRRCVRELRSCGLVVPVSISSAATIMELHERLHQWQEELLGVAYPQFVPARPEHAAPPLAGGRVRCAGVVRPHRLRRPEVARRAALWPARPGMRVTLVPETQAPTRLDGLGAGGDLNGLTEREVAVLRVVSEGLTNAQVAGRLHVSEHTVAAHLRSIFRKTDVASRSAATRYALEHGLT